MSDFSPGLVEGQELILRVVCSPMHVHKKRHGELKSSFLSHAESKGVSMQRMPHASVAELAQCVTSLVKRKEGHAWLGFVEAKASDIRCLQNTNGAQVYCVADAALEDNPAHAEIHISDVSDAMPEADRIESRAELLKLYGVIKGRKLLRNGAVWDALDPDVQLRPTPADFSD